MALRLWGVASFGCGDQRVRMVLVMRMTAPFFVPRRTSSALPCDLVYARVCGGGKMASAVKRGIVTPS
ncbi:predicted protein [Streptomyces viridochromogenes DSM 40736]|uniref:Predicted protein n=1 Tax=Streptomyces viridochromogenes (strain DSM 40736 / JCM 4977 / BCRC 1201 / Tue 494) TaxID=591159 RepID=D9XDV3_STRVT|nr:predicted protein [Streptomyces viridochromogenes DSM 40736]